MKKQYLKLSSYKKLIIMGYRFLYDNSVSPTPKSAIEYWYKQYRKLGGKLNWERLQKLAKQKYLR